MEDIANKSTQLLLADIENFFTSEKIAIKYSIVVDELILCLLTCRLIAKE
jgi:hypothetical protein